MSARIGILGGTFDPIHYGHLLIAEEARSAASLARVTFVPAGRQPLKHGAHVATPEQRLAMARLACADNPACAVSALEVQRPGLSYTVTTLEQLAAGGDQLHFLLGADALVDLPRWRDADRILELATLLVMQRPGHTPDLEALRRKLPLAAERIMIVETPLLDISSTELRRRIADGKSIRYLTPDPVIEYIRLHGLYREQGA